MQRLKNKKILIGREPGNGRLMIAMEVNGQMKTGGIGQPHCVPNSVSRCRPAENVAHCMIEVSETGQLMLKNLKDSNLTYVDGAPVMSKKISASSVIMLGESQFPVKTELVLDLAKKLLPEVKPEFSIAHLENVWNEYDKMQETIAQAQRKRGNKRLYPMMASGILGVLSSVIASALGGQTLWISIPISLIPLFMYINILKDKDTSYEDKKKAKEYLIDNYICPNPDCRQSLIPLNEYRLLKQKKYCPYCKAKWKE